MQLDQVLTDAAGDRAREPPDLPQGARRRARSSTAAPRASASSTGPPPAAFKNTSQVNQALLGTAARRPPGLASATSTSSSRALDANESHAPEPDHATSAPSPARSRPQARARARRSSSCRARSPRRARPSSHLNAAFPRAAGVRSRGAARRAVRDRDPRRTPTPSIDQLRRLVSKTELRGLVDDLRPDDPRPGHSSATGPLPFLEQSRALSSCFNNVIIPWSNTSSPDPDSDPPAGKVYQETAYGLRRCRRREPLRRRQRPGRPRRRRRRPEHDRSVRHRTRPPGLDRRGAVSILGSSRQAVLGQDPVPARRALRDPGAAEPRRRSPAARASAAARHDRREPTETSLTAATPTSSASSPRRRSSGARTRPQAKQRRHRAAAVRQLARTGRVPAPRHQVSSRAPAKGASLMATAIRSTCATSSPSSAC